MKKNFILLFWHDYYWKLKDKKIFHLCPCYLTFSNILYFLYHNFFANGSYKSLVIDLSNLRTTQQRKFKSPIIILEFLISLVNFDLDKPMMAFVSFDLVKSIMRYGLVIIPNLLLFLQIEHSSTQHNWPDILFNEKNNGIVIVW